MNTAATIRIASMSTADRNTLADMCATTIATSTDGLALGIAHGILEAINAHIAAEDAGVVAMSDAELTAGDAF